MSELKITKEKVLEAAAKCSTAKETLKTLFPEVFESEKYFDLSFLSDNPNTILITEESCTKSGFLNLGRNSLLQIRQGGEYKNKGFYLDDEVNWEIINEKYGTKVLVPTKK